MSADIGLRVLSPRAVLLGTGDAAALQNLDTTELPDGALCWVSDQTSYYVLHRDSSASPSGTIVVAPASGPGRWIILGSGSTSGELIVPNIAALAALPAPANGESAFVLTVRSSFQFETGSALAADAITIVDAADASGQWLRTDVPSLSWAYQAAWFLNATTGNDENVGSTSGTALKTAAELSRRITTQTLHQTTTVTQSTDLPEFVNLNVTLANNDSKFLWLADPAAVTTVFTGSGGLSAVTAINPATNTPMSITDGNTGGLNWNNWLGGFRIRITSAGPRQNAVGFVVKVISNTQARTTPFAIIDPTTFDAGLGTLATVTPLVNDQYVVETLPGVFGWNVIVNRMTRITGGIYTTAIADSIEIGKGAAHPELGMTYFDSPQSADGAATFTRCIHDVQRAAGLRLWCYATLFRSASTIAILDVFVVIGGGSLGSVATGQQSPYHAFGGNFIIQGGPLIIVAGTAPLGGDGGGVGIFDSPSDGLFLHEEQDAHFVSINDSGSVTNTLYGSGNAGFGINMAGGRNVNYEIVRPTITGNLGDISLCGQTVSWSETPISNPLNLCGITARIAGMGVVYSANVLGAIGATNIFTSTPPQGLYVIDVYVAVKTAGAAGDQVSVTIAWTDDSQAESVAVINAASVAAKGFFAARQLVETTGAANVTYAVSFPIKTGAPAISVRIVARQIQSSGV